MKIEDAMLKLPTLKNVGLALVEFVYSMEKGGAFALKDTDWIYTPNNFVAFGFPKRRPEQIRIQFRQPFPHYITKEDEKMLPLHDGRFHHFKCFVTKPRQLACATKYIEAAFLHPC
jgi:hypothetical protein